MRIIGLDDGGSNEDPYEELIKVAGYCGVSLKRNNISVETKFYLVEISGFSRSASILFSSLLEQNKQSKVNYRHYWREADDMASLQKWR